MSGQRRGRVLPAVGAVLAGAGALATAGLADSAREGDGLAAFDPRVSAALVGDRTPDLTVLARLLTTLGSEVSVSALAVLVAAVLAYRARSLRPAVLLLGAMAGAAALTFGVKVLVARHRPGPAYLLGPVDTGFGFPSGHTLTSTVFFGLLAGIAVARCRSLAARVGAVLGWVVLSAAIGLSRVYLGYHWSTDVLAAWVIGLGWLAAVAAAYGLWRLRRPRASRAGQARAQG